MAKGNRVAVVGVGYSKTGRNTGLTNRQLAVQAGKAAMDDAGMKPKDIDGVTVLPGVAGPEPPGADPIDSQDLAYMLGMSPVNWYVTVGGGPAFVAAAVNAYAAVKSGMCHTCIAFRVIKQRLSVSASVNQAGATRAVVRGDQTFVGPFGGNAAAAPIAGLAAERHMQRFGTTEEQFGAHVIAQREFASHNEDALLRTPLTMDDYLNSRYISKPMRLLDCDYPCDSASAVIFTTEERAHDWAKKPVFVEAAAYNSMRYMTFELIADPNESSPFLLANRLWSQTDLTPKDVSCAQIYDGFTIITFQWLEAFGFCGLGEAGPFVAAGNTKMGGSLPVNTDGGACNVGRRHGANFCIESVRQLRGNESGVRQVPNAKVAVWANAVGPFSGGMIMTAD